MGRPTSEVDMDVLMDFFEQGIPVKEMAEAFEISPPTMAKRIKELQAKHDVILEYKKLKSLHLTDLQHLLLSNITKEKIAEASLGEIAGAYKKLADSELAMEVGNDIGQVKGLVAHLLFLENQKENEEHPARVLTDLEFDEETQEYSPSPSVKGQNT